MGGRVQGDAIKAVAHTELRYGSPRKLFIKSEWLRSAAQIGILTPRGTPSVLNASTPKTSAPAFEQRSRTVMKWFVLK
jgi:hypothetical protein